MKFFGYVLIILILATFVLGAISFFKKNDLPPKELLLDDLAKEPVQTKVDLFEESFELEKDGFIYKIIPRYRYEIYGLSVAEYNAETWSDLFHEKDPLNVKDICLIWGYNALSGAYENIKFRHGEFTCFWSPEKEEIGLNNEEISNNHLLPATDNVYKKIKKAETGDQVYIKGYLVNYQVKGPDTDLYRTTSSIREDFGDGACEIIYVTDFKIIAPGNPVFNFLYLVTKNLLFVLLGIYFFFAFLDFAMKPLIKKKEIVPDLDYDPANQQSYPAAFNPPDEKK